MKYFVAVFMFVFLLAGFGCAKQNPLVLDFDREPVPAKVDNSGYSLEEIQTGILNACRDKGWSANVVEPGRIEASITIRSRHRAKVGISFNESSYSITYMDSSGLNYDNGHINARYNHWVAQLDAEIKRGFGLNPQRF